MLNRQLVKQIEDELNRDVASDDDAAVGAAMKANVEAQNPMNYAQDGPGTTVYRPTTTEAARNPTDRAPVKVPGENIISSRYGSRVMNGKTQMHEGLDIKGKTGEPIFSTGKGKAKAIRDTVEGPITAMVPASILQFHPYATVILDAAAASEDAVLDADAPQPIVSSKDSTDLDSDRDPVG